MGLYTREPSHAYAEGLMPARNTAHGPWGRAIRYWLPLKNMSGADLVRATGLGKNTISNAVRGFHVTTETLEAIAQGLGVSFEDVLVSPEYQLENEARRRLAQEAAENAIRKWEDRNKPPPARSVTSTTALLDSVDALAAEAERKAGKRSTHKKSIPKSSKGDRRGSRWGK